MPDAIHLRPGLPADVTPVIREHARIVCEHSLGSMHCMLHTGILHTHAPALVSTAHSTCGWHWKTALQRICTACPQGRAACTAKEDSKAASPPAVQLSSCSGPPTLMAVPDQPLKSGRPHRSKTRRCCQDDLGMLSSVLSTLEQARASAGRVLWSDNNQPAGWDGVISLWAEV